MTLPNTTVESMSDDQIQKRLNALTVTSEAQGPISQDRLQSMSDAGIQNRLKTLVGEEDVVPLSLSQQEEAYDLSLRDSTNFASIEDSFFDYKNNVNIIDSPSTGKIGFVESVLDADISEKLPFIGSMFKFNRINDLTKSVRIMQTGEVTFMTGGLFPSSPLASPPISRTRKATEDDKKKALKIVEDWVVELEERQRRGVSIGGKIAEVVTEMPAFIVEFVLTGPIFTAGSKAAKEASVKLLGRAAEKGIGKAAVRAAGAAFGSAARTLVNVPRIMAGAAEQMTPGVQFTDDGAISFSDMEVSPTTALLRSIGNLYVENITEIAGGALGEGATFAGKVIGKRFPVVAKITKELAEKWISKGAGRTISQFVTRTNTKIGYNGVLLELGEEELARVFRAAIPGLEDFDTNMDRVLSVIPSWEELLVETGAISILGAANLAVTKLFRIDPTPAPPMKETDLVLTEARELEIKEGRGDVPTNRELSAFLNLGAGKADVSLFESEKITKEMKAMLKERGKLAQSEKNSALADKRNAEALKFISERIEKPPKKGLPKILVPEDRPPKPTVAIEREIKITAPKAEPVISNPEIAEAAGVTKPDILSGIETGKAVSVDVVRGFGRATKGEVYTSGEGEPAFGVGRYSAIDETFAEHFGPKIEKLTVQLDNPFVLTNDEQLVELVGRPIPRDGDPRKQFLKEAREKIEELGHDGIIINIPNFGDVDTTGKSAKRLVEISGATQTVEFSPFPAKEIEAEKSIKTINLSTKGKALAGKIVDSSTEKLTDIAGNIALGIARAEDALGFMGKTGLKVQKDFREIAFRTAVNVGNTSQNIKIWTKGLNKQEKITVAQLIDGAIAETGQPPRLVERARKIKEQLDLMQKEALSVKLRKEKLTGKAFPQVLNKEGKALLEEAERDQTKSDRVFAWAQTQVNDGRFKNVDDAIIALVEYRRKRLSGKEGYIEGTRTLEIGNEFRDWSLDKILQGTIENSWEKIEAARQWGVVKKPVGPSGETLLPFKQIQIDIEKIRADIGNNQANSLGNYVRAQYGLSGANTVFVKWARRARVVQFVGKLAFSPLTISRNILDRFSKGLAHGTISTNVRATIQYPPFLNNWMKSSQLIEDQMVRRGAVLGHGHLSEGVTTAEGLLPLAAKPFAESERGNQTYIALVKKIQLESDVKRLMELQGRDGDVSKVFDRMTAIVGQSQTQTTKRALTSLTNEQLADAMTEGKISDDVMSEVLHRTVTDSAFPLTLASKRLWWGSRPEFQVATQFKVWAADQTRFIYKDVMKYGVQTGDWSRLGRFILGTWLAGELYNIARDELLNKDESVLSKAKGGTKLEIVLAIRDDLVDGGIVGFVSDFTYGIGDWAAGPTINTISNALAAPFEAKGAANIVNAAEKFLLNDVPALRQAQGVIDNLDSIFDKNNLTEDYARWQGRSFDFRRKQGDSISSNIFLRSVRGIPQQKITERSLSLEMIARQVLVGDYDDAAKHIKRVIRNADIDKVESAIQSLAQSMKNNSPWGNISQEKLPLFITQFSPEEAVKGIKLQEQWLRGYAESLNIAVSELKAEGLKEDLEAKVEAYKKKMEPVFEKAKERLKEIREELK